MFHYFRVSKNVTDKSGGGGGGGEATRGFPPKLFRLRIPRHFFVEEFFCAVFKKISSRENVYG